MGTCQVWKRLLHHKIDQSILWDGTNWSSCCISTPLHGDRICNDLGMGLECCLECCCCSIHVLAAWNGRWRYGSSPTCHRWTTLVWRTQKEKCLDAARTHLKNVCNHPPDRRTYNQLSPNRRTSNWTHLEHLISNFSACV